jgi:hypothetical protein
VSAAGVVEALDVLEIAVLADALVCQRSRGSTPSDRGHERLRHRVVVCIPTAPHRRQDARLRIFVPNSTDVYCAPLSE